MSAKRVLVTDFDGTITEHDFYRLVADELLTPHDLKPWEDFKAGQITHFEAMRRIYARISAPEERMLKLLRDMTPDPNLAYWAKALREAGWQVAIASAGCAWYIKIILGWAGVDSFEINASPGIYHPGGPLELFLPVDSPFYCLEYGINKAGMVRHYQAQGALVAYAGDSFTDLEAALLVPPHLRFATAVLRKRLQKLDEGFVPFARWGEITQTLLELK